MKGLKPRGGPVVSRPETRVDGDLSPRAKKLALQKQCPPNVLAGLKN